MADQLTIPDSLKPARRPVRVRTVQGPARTAAGAGDQGRRPVRHIAPAGARQEPRRPGSQRAAGAVLGARRIRGGARQRRVHRVLGRRRLRPRRPAVAAPDLRRVQRQVRLRRRQEPVRRRPDHRQGRSRQRTGTPVRSVGDVIAWAHNETSTGVAVPVRRPADSDGRSSSSSTPRPAPAGCRSTSPTPTPTTSRRRRTSPATAGCGSRSCRPRRWPASSHRGGRPLGARVPVAADRDRQQHQEPDLQHACDRHPAADGRAARLAQRQRRAGLGRQAHRRQFAAAVLVGRGRLVRDTVRRRPGVALAGGRHHRLRRLASMPPRSPRRSGPTASSTPSRTASWAATSCGWRCSRPSIPTTSAR